MKYYRVIDNQGANFMDWTKDKPITKQFFRAYLCDMANEGKYSDDDKWDYKHFTSDDACEIWGIELEEVKQ